MKRSLILMLTAASLFLGATREWFATSVVCAEEPPSPALVPWPKQAQLAPGKMELSPAARIVASEEQLLPLAKVLSEEIAKVAELTLPAVIGEARPGDILLQIDPSLSGEAYRLQVADLATARGGNYRAVAWATVTLLQTLECEDTSVFVPRLVIDDEPATDYRGLLIDVARRWHSPAVLEQCIELCRLYKIKYLQLHLTDDQAFTFPSTAFPQVTSSNADARRSYTLDELKGLEEYANRRGVTIIPELEVPGHATAMVKARLDIFEVKGHLTPYTVNFAKEEAIAALDVIVGEMCDVFRSSPYFHIGGDEADLRLLEQDPDIQAASAKYGLGEKGQRQLYRRFLIQMNDIVKKHGRQMIVWEGFRPDPASQFQIPKDVIVMEYECPFYPPERLIEDGYTMINAAWTPLYVVGNQRWRPENIYDWNLDLLGQWTPNYTLTQWHQLAPTPQVLGAQMCAWEQPQEMEISSLRSRLAPMSERIWNPTLNRSYSDYERRRQRTDRLLDRLFDAVTFQPSGLTPAPKEKADIPQFEESMMLSLHTDRKDAQIRFTLDGRPVSAVSPLYTAPMQITDTCTVQAAAFDATGQPIGLPTAEVFYKIQRDPANLALGKPVTVSGGTVKPYLPEFAVNGATDKPGLAEFNEKSTTDGYSVECWKAKPWPQWLQVDLGQVYDLSRVAVFFFWDETRFYQYNIEASVDGRTWQRVVDQTENTAPAKPTGEEFKFPAQKARYLRMSFLKCSNDDGFGLIEVQTFGS